MEFGSRTRRTTLATVKLPDPLSRRHLLEGALDSAKAKALAEAYLEVGRELDAIEFLARAGDRESLVALQETAIERGDVFLMKAACRGLGEDAHADRWQALARIASERGRHHDAEAALRLATVDG
jgi:hypothetical protein